MCVFARTGFLFLIKCSDYVWDDERAQRVSEQCLNLLFTETLRAIRASPWTREKGDIQFLGITKRRKLNGQRPESKGLLDWYRVNSVHVTRELVPGIYSG